MAISLVYQKLSRVLFKTFLLVLGISFPATAFSFDRSPLDVNKYETTITTSGNPADIYYPDTSESDEEDFPVALLLQGALVDKADYSNFASQVASHGFVVVVPNNFQSIPEFGEVLLPEVSQIEDVLAYVQVEDSNSASPLEGIVDPENLALLGHSQGGAVGLSAIGNYCLTLLCNDSEFTLPEEVFSGIFYGAFLRDFPSGEYLSIDNNSVPVGLISGSRDGVSTPDEIQASFAEIQDPPKALITVKGANHYGITNEDSLRDPTRPTLDQDVATETIASLTSLFLKGSLFLQDNELQTSQADDFLDDLEDLMDENVMVDAQLTPDERNLNNLRLLASSSRTPLDENLMVEAESQSVIEPNSTISILALGLTFFGLRRSGSKNVSKT